MTATTHPTFTTGPLHAEAYDAMTHDPEHPTVRASYAALSTAIAGQWNGLRHAGFEFEASSNDPYASSWAMLEDACAGGIRVFTDGGASLPSDHPMQAAPTVWGCIGAEAIGFRTMNDVFRGVHDVMGHAAARREGLIASFGPVGEYNAWVQHARSMPSMAYLALWCETRGQNAWTNFHANHAELPLAERPYVDQRAGIPSLPLVPTPLIVIPGSAS